MISFRYSAWLVVLFLGSSYPTWAQEPIRFARTPDISPDGKQVAFSYLGDIWTVETIGGIARPVTQHEAHDVNPCYSPDGRMIAFSSNRFGSYDIFVIPSHGGKPVRLTFDSAQDMVTGWAPDGKSILFSSTRGTSFPQTVESYSVPLMGGQEHKLPYREAKEVALSPTGDVAAFSRGPGIWYRKGYRGSSNDDLWLANSAGTEIRRLTDFNAQDTSPMWSPDGKKLYFVSEMLGTSANIVCQELNRTQMPPTAEGKPRLITQHKDDPVRRPRISGNGEWVVYECGGDLWVASTRDGNSRKMAIEANADDKTNVDRQVTFTKDVTEYAISPDEGSMAFVVHGEIFAMPIRGGKANRLTNSPALDHGISWSPDGKKILFISDRTGHQDMYIVESDDSESVDLTKALKTKTKALTDTPEAESGASFSPDGSKILFIRSGKLWSMKPDGTDVKVVVDQTQVFDYDWSPDGKWIVYARTDGSFASELYLVPLDGSQPARNVTRYATYNGDVSWNNTNNKIAFLSQRRGNYCMHVLSLQRPGSPAATGGADIDWEDIHLRVDRPSSMIADEGSISRNGRQVAFRGSNNGADLWVVGIDGNGLNRLSTGNIVPRMIRWGKSGTIYFLDKEGNIRTSNSVPNFSGLPTNPGTIGFSAKMLVRRNEEYLEMFDQTWRSMADNFYDDKHHGADWRAIRAKYRPLVNHLAMKEDLYNLISLMLGELNASHLGISGPTRNPEEATADLGLIYDEWYRGPGLKVAEVLRRGPADKRGLNIKPGDIVLSIDRVELNEKTNISELLNSKIGESILVELAANPADPKTRRKVEIQGANRGQISDLMYHRWVANNAEAVTKESKGTLGYIHIPSMDDAGLEQFVRSLYSDNFDRDAIVIDVRYNGGGFTHDQVLNYLGAKEHTFFRQRDGGQGLVLRAYDRKWTKPMAVLINNRSYSDAEIFPSAFRTLGYGKVIGQPTGGLVIGTTSTRLIDGSTLRLPRTGVFTAKGINMEREGVIPDIIVDSQPEDVVGRTDPQIKKAVDVLMVDVALWKKTRNLATGTPTPPPQGTSPGMGTSPANMTPTVPTMPTSK